MKFLVSQMAALVQRGQQKANTRLMIRFLLILLGFFAAFTVLFHFLMAYEGQDHSWITGLYWTLTVMSTLGFGDITFTSDLGRLFSIFVMLSGVVFMLIVLPFTFIQFFYAPWLEEQNKARAPRKVPDTLSDHVILTFCDAITLNLVDKFNQYGIKYVILVPDLQQALNLHETGLNVVLGELDDPETYLRLRVREAAMVVVMNEDVASTNIIFTIREVADKTPIITNADQEDSVDILDLAGSTHTYQFTTMLGQVLARRVMGVSMKANVIGNFDELLIAEAPALQGRVHGRSQCRRHLGTGALLFARPHDHDRRVHGAGAGRFRKPVRHLRSDHGTKRKRQGTQLAGGGPGRGQGRHVRGPDTGRKGRRLSHRGEKDVQEHGGHAHNPRQRG